MKRLAVVAIALLLILGQAEPTHEARALQPVMTVDKLYLGQYHISAYCACEKCCGKSDGITSSGAVATEGITVACNSLPQGTVIEIEGIGERIVQDKLAQRIDDRYDGMIIDLYISDHQTALNFGVKKLDVYEVKEAE